MSVQWWVGEKRIDFEDAVEARDRGQFPMATVDAVEGRPLIRANTLRDGRMHVMLPDADVIVPGMVQTNVFLKGIDWERQDAGRRKSEEEKGQHARRQQGEPAPVIETDGHAVTCPDYYRIPRDAVDVWDIVAALGMTHCHAAALEYIYRAGRKPGASKADDLRKAVANLEYEIARLEAISGRIVACRRCGDDIEVCNLTSLGDNQLRAAGWGQTPSAHEYGLWFCPGCFKAAIDDESEVGQ